MRAAKRCLAGLLASLALAACGGDEEPEQQPAGPAAAETAVETRSEPPPETAPEGADATATGDGGGEGSENAVAEEATTGPQSCPDVVITPNSGNGLFDVEAEGITCEDATAALEAWGASGYPGDGPPGFACEELPTSPGGSARLSCRQVASGAVLEFDPGT